MKSSVVVNQEQYNAIGKIVEKYHFRPSFYQKESFVFKADNETKVRSYLYASSICHQTHSLINEKLNLKGWDYLLYEFVKLAKKNDVLLNPKTLSTFKQIPPGV